MRFAPEGGNALKQIIMESTILKGIEVTGKHYETGLIPDVKNFEMEVVNLYPQKTYQTIEGFGAALTFVRREREETTETEKTEG